MTRHDTTIRVKLPGNPGNMMFMYLSALSIQRALGFGTVANVSIDMFDIRIPDQPVDGRVGLHLREHSEHATHGRLPLAALRHMYDLASPDFVQIEGYCQHVDNLPSRDDLDYQKIFPRPGTSDDGGNDDELVISIRGDEILKTVRHPHYVQIPQQFYADLIKATGLKPVFFGQIGDNPYCNALRRRFRNATFRVGTSPAADFDFLRRSKNIVPSVSTFAWLAAWLSNASRIFMPVLGLFHPLQHRQSFFLPRGDRRYNYFLFPFNYWADVDFHTQAEQSLHRRWEAVSEDRLINLVGGPSINPRDLNDHARCLDVDFYVQNDPALQAQRARYGDSAVFNHYLEQGFVQHRPPMHLDPAWYCLTYPDAAAALSRNEYHDEIHHFAAAGSRLGYRPRP